MCVCGSSRARFCWGRLAYQQVTVWDGKQEFDEGLQGVIERVVPVQAEDTKVDVAAAQRSLQHGETDGDAFELQGIHLILWNLTEGQNTISCKSITREPKKKYPLSKRLITRYNFDSALSKIERFSLRGLRGKQNSRNDLNDGVAPL